MKKKLLSLMLALVMVLGMVPLGGLALAADGSPVFAVTAPANKTIEATAEKQEIGKPAYTVDSSISTVAVGVKYTKLTSGDNSIGLVMSGTRTGFGDSAFNSVSGLDGGGLPVIYVAGESADIQEERELTFYAQANSSDLASAAPGTYTATLTYIFWITPNDGGRLTREQTRTLTLVIPEPYTLTAPANKTIEATAEKQEIGKPAFTADSTVKDIAVGVKYTMLTSGDKSIGLTISGKNQLIGEEAFEPRNGESVEGGMPIIYVASDSADVQAKRELTIYAQANSADLADAAPGTYTATLTYVFWITPKEGKSITEERTQTLTLVVPEPAVTEYPLWVGETQVTSANKGDILGDQSASFDPETNTLTFTVEQPAITGLYQTFKIYAFNMDLVINSPGKLILNKNSTRGNCIAAYNHDLTVNGDVDLTAENSCIAAKNITVNGSVTATGGRVINADPGSVTIYGDAKLISTDYAIWANTDITVTGSVDASAKTGAVYAYGNVTIGGSLNAADAVNNSKLTSVYAGGDLSVGGDVTVKNKENYDYGIVSMTGKITVGSGRWEAEGFRGAMWAKKGIIIPQTHLIHVPENGSVGEADLSGVNGYSVLNKDGETAKRAVIERVVEYPLWLGETRVTSANKGDILGDQSASFDPGTNTLTFTKSDPAITGLYQFLGYAYGFMITSDGINLTINAPNGLTLNSEAGGIFCRYGGLTVNGNLTVSAKKQTLNANYITVNGDLDASASFTHNIFCKGDLKVSGDVKAGGESGFGIIVYGKLRVGSGRWEIEGNDIAVFATNGIVIPDTHIVTTPENGQVGEAEYHYNITVQGLSILDSEGAVAKKVVIEPIPVTYYPLWLGETQVTSRNKDDILGDRTASFDPETNNLTFTVETPAIVGTHEDALIYADGINLTINAAEKLTLVNNEIEYGDCVVVLSGDLTINGDVDVTADYYGLRGSNVTVNGDLKAVGNQAVRAQTGSVYIDGNANVTGVDYGIYASDSITVTGNVKAEGEEAVYAYDGSVSIGGDANITGVERGIYAFENVTVTGDIVAQAPGCAVSAERGNLVVGGSLTATEGTSDAETERYTCAVFGYVDVVVGGSLTVKTKWAYGVYGQNAVTVGPGKWDIESGTAAICRGEEIIIPETHGFTLPEGGKIVKDDYCGDYYTSNEDGSYAAHVIIERVRNIKGDLTGEGLVDNRDLILLARYLVHLEELDEMQLAAADFNEDGTVNNSDLVQIARYIVSEQG